MDVVYCRDGLEDPVEDQSLVQQQLEQVNIVCVSTAVLCISARVLAPVHVYLVCSCLPSADVITARRVHYLFPCLMKQLRDTRSYCQWVRHQA